MNCSGLSLCTPASNIAAVIVEPVAGSTGFDCAERLFRAAAGDLRQIRNSANF